MSKEDLKEANPESKIKLENTIKRPLPHSGAAPKDVGMKETFDPARQERASGKRSSPHGTATPMSKDPKTPTTSSSSYSYLNNPKINFGSEVPHTLNSDASRLNTPPSTITSNRKDSNSVLERIAFPYKLLKKYIASLPETFYGSNGTAEHLNGKRDVGTLVQTMSLILNGQNIPEENENSSLKNFMTVPTSIEPLKVTNGTTQPLPRSVSGGGAKHTTNDVSVYMVPPLLVEMLHPEVLAKESDTSENNSMSPSGTLLTKSSKATDLFKVISKHVMSLTSPGQSFDGNHTPLPRFRNQTCPLYADSMFLLGRRSSDGSITIVDDSLTLSNEENVMSEQLENCLSSEFSTLDTKLSEQDNVRHAVVDSLENVTNDLRLGKGTKSITVLELPNQTSLHNLFNEEYTSGKRKHSFLYNNASSNDDNTFDNKKKEFTEKCGSGVSSAVSSFYTQRKIQKNARPAGKISMERLMNVETEPVSVEHTDSLTTMDLPTQLSLHNLFDEDYLSGKKKHSFSSEASKRHTSEDTTLSSLTSSKDSMQDTATNSDHGRKGETQSVVELRSLMATLGLLEKTNVNEKCKTKAQPLEYTSINFDDSFQDVTGEFCHAIKGKSISVQALPSMITYNLQDGQQFDGIGKTTKHSSESIRINFDESVHDAAREYGQGPKWESSSVHELRALMSKHGLLDDTNVHGKPITMAQPSESIRINFDDSIEYVTSKPVCDYKEKCPLVQDLVSLRPEHGILNDKNVPGGKTEHPLENSKRLSICFKESMPTIVLYREESFVPGYKNPMQDTEEFSDTEENEYQVLIKENDDSLTIEIIEQNSDESNMPLQGTPSETTQEAETDTTSTKENKPYISFGSDQLPRTISDYLTDEDSGDPFKGDTINREGNHTDVDEKLVCDKRKSSRDLHSMLNSEILHRPKSGSDSSCSELPITLYESTPESNDTAYEMSADSIDDSESRFERLQLLQAGRRPTKFMPDCSEPLDKDVSQETPSESYESRDEMAPEDSMEVSGTASEDSQKSDTFPNGSSTIPAVALASESSELDFDSKDSKSVHQTGSLSNWCTMPVESLVNTKPVDEKAKASDLLDDEFDSTFKFSQLQFPTYDPTSERSETSEASLWPASETSEPSGDEGTLDSSIIEDARVMKFLTTGSVKSSDIDEKLSEAHGHSKTSFNKYENTNERKLNLGTKSSGHMPKPREMLSIYSRGESDPPRVISAKSSSSLSMAIKPATQKNTDPHSVEGATPNKSVGRSVSFSEERKEFPWRRTDVLSTPMAVTQAQVETDSPLVDKQQKDKDRSSDDKNAARNSTTGANGNAPEDGDVRNDNGNEPKKNASKDDAGQQQAAAKRRSSSTDGSGKRAKSKQKVDEEPKRSNSNDKNQTSIFSLDNILPYMRMFFTPVMDEVALDTLHVLRGDPGCELCPQRRQEDEEQARVIPRSEGGESGDEERPRENDENAEEEQEKQVDDRHQSNNKEQDNARRKPSHKDEGEKEEDGKDKRRRSSSKDQREKEEDEEDKRRKSENKDNEGDKEVEDDKSHPKEEESKNHVEDEKEESGNEERRRSSNKDHEKKKEVEDGKSHQDEEVGETERVQEESKEK